MSHQRVSYEARNTKAVGHAGEVQSAEVGGGERDVARWGDSVKHPVLGQDAGHVPSIASTC